MGINSKDNMTASALALRDSLRVLQRQLSLPQLVALLTIHSNPGLSVNDLAETLDVPQQSASRHVAFLAGRYQNELSEIPPKAFVTQQINPNDPRSRALHLTDEGAALIRQLLQSTVSS